MATLSGGSVGLALLTVGNAGTGGLNLFCFFCAADGLVERNKLGVECDDPDPEAYILVGEPWNLLVGGDSANFANATIVCATLARLSIDGEEDERRSDLSKRSSVGTPYVNAAAINQVILDDALEDDLSA